MAARTPNMNQASLLVPNGDHYLCSISKCIVAAPNTVERFASAETLAESVGWKVYWPIRYLMPHVPTRHGLCGSQLAVSIRV